MKILRSDVELAINRCRAKEGVDGCTVPPDVSALADIYGLMIFEGATEIEAGRASQRALAALAKWADNPAA